MSRRHSARKDAQLCAQVREAIGFALAEDVEMTGCWVREVRPAPDIGRMLVIVESSADVDAGALHTALVERVGALRNEIAGAIHRKKVPDLVFQVLGPADPTTER